MKLKTQNNLLPIAYCLLPIVCFLIIGCQNSEKKEDPRPAVSAVWENQAGPKHWKFTLLEDGTLSEVIRADSQIMILAEGGTEINGPDFLLRYIFGPCEWSYDEKTRALKISIVIDDFYVKSPGAELRCMLIDEFEGPISKDGRTWTAKWTNTMRYDQAVPDRVSDGGTLKFHKVE